MKCRMQKLLCIAFSLALLLTFTACGKEAEEEGPKPDSTPQGGASFESEPQGDRTECQTYSVPVFGIEFDCPADFGGEVKANVVSKDEASFSLSTEDRVILLNCSRIASLKDTAELYNTLGEDVTALYEKYQTLDVNAEIADWRNAGFKTFELLDSFSTPDSYGFYYIGEEDFGDYSTQLGYNYKNYGSFGEPNDLIRVYLHILAPERMGRDEFTALCETVTNSLRLVQSPSENGAPEGGAQASALKPLAGGTYDQQCREIVELFFDYASPSGTAALPTT